VVREWPKAPGWSWERLFETAADERVLPALAFAVDKGLDISAPRDVADFLSAVLLLNRERNRAIWLELKTALQLLNSAGIEPVLLKGAAYFASGVYPDLGVRYLQDLDLLIPNPQLNDAFQCLVDHGYTYDRTDQFGPFRHHFPPLCRASVALELHHQLGLGPCDSILSASEVIAHATPLEIDGLRVHIPSPTHLMTHLVMHSQIQHPYNERIWPPIRAILDLLQLQNYHGPTIDWIEVESRFRNAGHAGLLRLHLLDVHDALGLAPPIDCRLTPLTYVRGLRRRVLRQFPALRYLDPIYMFSAVCLRRVRVVRNVLASRGGVERLLTQLTAPGVYERFFWDVLEGRGR
jgi:Uncharacterised nucleotidyltransferase